MKNIPPSVLPNFYGMASEDPDSFLFEFDIVCRTYVYIDNAHRIRLFPATLKAWKDLYIICKNQSIEPCLLTLFEQYS